MENRGALSGRVTAHVKKDSASHLYHVKEGDDMRKKYVVAVIVLAIIAVFYTSKIYLPIIGTVIDAESGRPIEGAVVLAQWTKTHGFGEYYHTVYKIEETQTSNDDKFTIAGANNPFVDVPILVIYKKEYIAWRNDILFPDFAKRTNYGFWKKTSINWIDLEKRIQETSIMHLSCME